MIAAVLSTMLLWALAPLAQADVYTYTDAQGNQVFTDQPHKGAKRVQLPPSNRVTLPPPPAPPPPARTPPRKAIHYEMLRILAPAPDTAISQASGNVVVTVTSEPALQPGDGYRLVLDGSSVGEPQSSPVLEMSNVDRGTHQLGVEIVAPDGIVIERTPPQPFHLQRMSLAQKRRMKPCEEEDYGVRPECPLADKPEEE